MAWVVVNAGARRTKYWQDDANPQRRAIFASLASLHYESDLDSEVFDAPVDLTPVRVTNAALDGWRITQNGWHYALGQPGDKATDGWVGFGGRSGQNWFQFRLARVGYIHWPTRAWQDIGGAPTYNRSNLSNATQQITFEPDGSSQVICNIANWRFLWTTPGGGELSAQWTAGSDRLEERVGINQAARTWLRNNRPPSTPISETWFGFVFQLDWTDIPKIVLSTIQTSPDGDWEATDLPVELRDAADRLLALLPISDAWVEEPLGEEIAGSRRRLRKRFYRDGDQFYLVVGLRIDVLLGMPGGWLIIDPTVNPAVATSLDDAYELADGTCNPTALEFDISLDTGDAKYMAARFQINIPNGSTINTAYMTWYSDSGSRDDADVTIDCEVDAAQYSTGANDISSRSLVGSPATWQADSLGVGFINTSSVVTPVQAAVNAAGWAANDYMGFVLEAQSTTTIRLRFQDQDSSAPSVYIDYTEGGAPAGQPMSLRAAQVPGMRQWQPRYA